MSDGLYETLSIRYNLQLFAEIFNINSKRVDQLLKITDLYELRNKKVAKLSSGENSVFYCVEHYYISHSYYS